MAMTLDSYDAGLLGNFGGGDVGWWQDYLRAELDRAHDFYQSQIDARLSAQAKGGDLSHPDVHVSDAERWLSATRAVIEEDAARLSQGAHGEAELFPHPWRWRDGAPLHPWSEEWFLAETVYGDRVVLKALPSDYSYDFKTADETYIQSDKIKRWAQFPDSDFVEQKDEPAERAAVPDDFDGERYCDMVDAYDEAISKGWNREQAMGCAIRAYFAAPQPPEGARVVDAIPAAPLSGEWRYNNGYLCCGTFRVMVQDWEAGVCAAGDMRQQVGKWIAEALNRNGGGIDAWAIADKVRHALDKQSCPDHWMRVAFEATVSSIQAAAPTLAGKEG